MKKWFVMMMSICLFIGQLEAKSLWNEKKGNLFTEDKVLEKGDIVTIIIKERGNARLRTRDDLEKDIEIAVQPRDPGGAVAGAAQQGATTNILASLPVLGLLFENNRERQLRAQRDSTLEATITAKVIKVLPNGNYVIEGHKKIKINSELQELVVRGEVRSEDITQDNTILSDRLANATVSYTGKPSSATDPDKRNILARILDKIRAILF